MLVRGAVASADGERVGYALVRLEPGYPERFSDEAGGFFFAGVTPGSYRLMVRQVGYVPLDTAISVAAGMPRLNVTLRRVAVTLRALTVSAPGRCENPGNPALSGNAELIAVFEQLRQNAERSRILAREYPFRYTVERTQAVHVSSGGQRVTVDTVRLDGRARWPYRPGQIVTPDPDSRGGYLVHLPVLDDFADSAFHASHCFVLAGLDNFEEDSGLVRLDFTASRRIPYPDVNGSAWLDPRSYQIRHTRVTLTNPDDVARNVQDWRATTSFREIAPNIVVQGLVRAVTAYSEWTWRNRRNADAGRTEVQKLLGVHFERPLPTAQP